MRSLFVSGSRWKIDRSFATLSEIDEDRSASIGICSIFEDDIISLDIVVEETF